MGRCKLYIYKVVEIPSISLEGRMAQSVYKLWQARPTEAWHQLPEEEQQRLLSQVMKALNTAGGKELVICSAAWSNERWAFVGVEDGMLSARTGWAAALGENDNDPYGAGVVVGT